MYKLLFAAALLLIINACNDHGDKHSEHSGHDTSMNHTQSDGENNEMKKLMDGMMTSMHQQKSTGNNNIDYANMMLQHHQGAVDMAKLQIDKGSDTALKSFSAKVISDQQKEISLMAQFISSAQATASPNNDVFKKAMDASMETMMSANTKVYNDIDKDFVAQMIPHHQSAVHMAKAYLVYGTDSALKKMSESIVSSQRAEIEWLKGRDL